MQCYEKYQYVVSFRTPFLHSWAKILCGVAKSGADCHALAFSDPSRALLCTTESAPPGSVIIKDEQAGGANEPMEWDAGNRPDGSCVKRIALRSPMQRAAMAHAACCDGCCTALRHSAEDTDVGQGGRWPLYSIALPPLQTTFHPSARYCSRPGFYPWEKSSEPFLLNCEKASSCGMGCSGRWGNE